MYLVSSQQPAGGVGDQARGQMRKSAHGGGRWWHPPRDQSFQK